MKYKQLLILVFSCVFLFLEIIFHTLSANAREISILTSKGMISYSLEVADTPNRQQKGLMYRKNMPLNQGMLFDFPQPKPVYMWMKNTYIPLDMLFVDELGIVQHIHENAHPLDETIITCPVPVKYVIELNAGQVKDNHIQIGNKIKDIE